MSNTQIWTNLCWARPHPAVCWSCLPLHLYLLFNPQSLPLSSSFTACTSYLFHPLYQFLSLSIPLQTHMPSLLRGCLDSDTHHGASVRASLVLLLSSHIVCPSGLVTELAPLRDDGRRNGKKEGRREIKLRTGEWKTRLQGLILTICFNLYFFPAL